MKLYADESGAQFVRNERVLVVSAIARVEVPAAIWRKHRAGELDAGSTRALVAEFEGHWSGTDKRDGRFVVIDLPAAVLDKAARLTAVHGLHTYDAVQLASALTAVEAGVALDAFVCFDEDLRGAAAAEGLRISP